MRKPLLLLLLTIFMNSGFSQKNDTLSVFMDADFKNATKAASFYNGIAFRVGNQWFQKFVYPNGQPMIKAYFKEKSRQTKNGPYVFYHENGQKADEGTFINNVQEGIWKYYYASGKLKDSGMVVHGRMAGTWTSWHENGQVKSIANYPSYDSLEKASKTVVIFWIIMNEYPSSSLNGGFISYHSNGHLDSKGSYLNNQRTGSWEFYYENGEISTKEEYKEQKLESLECFDSTGFKTNDHCALEREPYPILDERTDFKTYMYDHIIWPKELLKQAIDGVVFGEYTITRNGELIDFKITSSVHELLSKETERFFKSLKQWVPAVSHNRNIDYTMKFIIPFNNSGIIGRK